MDISNITTYVLIEIIGVALALSLWSKKDKSLISTGLLFTVFTLGLVILAKGIGSLSTAGAINAILTFESAKQPVAQVAFDRLHSSLDPALLSGYADVFLGSLILAAGFTKLHRPK